jgi:aminodeoxyfutalosine synthase
MRRQDLLRLIREAGRDPVERDTLYRPVERTDEPPRRDALTVLV